MPQTATPPPRSSSGSGRIAALIGGSLLGLLALAAIAAGGLMLWANAEKNSDGYLATGSDPFATRTYALATDNLDLKVDGPGWLVNPDHYGKVRLQVKSRDGKPVFVGIAPTKDVAKYLGGTDHAAVTTIDSSPFRVDYRAERGDRKPAAPAAQQIWAASAHGSGTQKLTWNVKEGDWSVVVMNEDASPGVRAGVSAGAELPFLTAAGWGTLGGGLLLLGAAGGVILLGTRASRRGVASDA
jgi:hypothetical protein